jgi:serine/threonine-protein kinase HipA
MNAAKILSELGEKIKLARKRRRLSLLEIYVYADWLELGGLRKVGVLQAEQLRGKEVFSFSYHNEWLESGFAIQLDPDLNLFTGPQYLRDDKPNFGLFMDSSPDRWGRVLMLQIAEGKAKRFSQDYHTFLTRRFDRIGDRRIHFASAMTLLGYTDGMDAAAGVSYLHLAEFLMRHGAAPDQDMEELWRRIVFNILVSNSDDHLRNHGFLLTPKGWRLSPAFDINPVPRSTGLTLNISEHSNALDIDLAREVAEQFRVGREKREKIIAEVSGAVSQWHYMAKRFGISRGEVDRMEEAFFVT